MIKLLLVLLAAIVFIMRKDIKTLWKAGRYGELASMFTFMGAMGFTAALMIIAA